MRGHVDESETNDQVPGFSGKGGKEGHNVFSAGSSPVTIDAQRYSLTESLLWLLLDLSPQERLTTT